MIILGLDPGLGTTGWGLIEAEGNRLAHVANGQIRTDTGAPLPRRLAALADQLEASERISADRIAAAYAKALGHDVRAVAVPRDLWEAEFRAAGMSNPLPRMQMIDGFNQGWIDFADGGAHARKATTTIDQVIADIVARS